MNTKWQALYQMFLWYNHLIKKKQERRFNVIVNVSNLPQYKAQKQNYIYFLPWVCHTHDKEIYGDRENVAKRRLNLILRGTERQCRKTMKQRNLIWRNWSATKAWWRASYDVLMFLAAEMSLNWPNPESVFFDIFVC